MMNPVTRRRSTTGDALPPELAMLRILARQDEQALRAALSRPSADTVGFLRFAHRHLLGAYVYWALRRLGLTELLSPRLRVAAKATALRARSISDELVSLMRDIAGLFEREGTDLLFLKGPLFSHRFYGSTEGRAVADVDILIRSRDLGQVDALLRKGGFRPAFRLPIGERAARFFAHHFEYRRGDLPLDVHWVLQRHFSFAIDEERIWRTATTIEFGGRAYRATADEYELVLQVLGVITDLQVGKLTLRPLVDIHQILRAVHSTIDWREFLACRRREKILGPTTFVLALTLEALDCHEEFSSLAGLLQVRLRSLPPIRHALHAALDSRPAALDQKLLALRLYDTPLAAAAAWWLVSLPIRLAVYGLTRNPFGT